MANRFQSILKAFNPGLLFGARVGREAGPLYADKWRTRPAPTMHQLIDEYKGIAYACANLNARGVASVPRHLYATVGRGMPTPKHAHRGVSSRTKSWLRTDPFIAKKMAGGGDVVEITDSPILDLMDAVNDELDGFVLDELTGLYQEVTGLAYWYVETVDWQDDEAGQSVQLPSKIWLIPPQLLTPIRTDQGIVSYRFMRDGGEIPAEEIVAFKFPNLRDPYGDGWSPLRAAIESVDLSNKDLSWANTLMDNQARPDLVIKSKHGGMSRDESRRLRRSIQSQFAKGGSGGAIVIEDDVDITPLTYSSKQLELLARRGVSKVDIANAYDVPIPLLEAKEINRATLEGALYQHAKLCVLPRVRRYCQRLNAKFLPRFDDRLFFGYDNPVPEDEQDKATIQGMDLSTGTRAINEVRAERGLDPVEWGERPWLAAGMTQIGDDPLPAEQDAPPVEASEAPAAATADPAAIAAEQASRVQDIQTAEANVLNGAQITSALAIVQAVASGQLPRDSGMGMLEVLFNLSPQQAVDVMGSAGTGSVTTPNTPEGGKPAPPEDAPPANPIAPDKGEPDGEKPDKQEPPEEDAAGKSAAVALSLFAMGELSRAEAIAKMLNDGIPYAKSFQWTQPRATPLPHIPPHAEKAPGGRDLRIAQKGLRGKLKAIFARQKAAVLAQLTKSAAAPVTKDKTSPQHWWDALNHVDLSDWNDEMAKECRPFIELGYDAGGTDFLARNGLAKGDNAQVWNVTNPKAKDAIDQATMRFCSATNQTTSLSISDAVNKLRDDLAEGIASEDQNTGRALTQIVQDTFDEADHSRAERIALTESSRAVHGGQVMAAKESGIVSGFKWLLSDNACPICQEMAKANPGGVGLDQSFGSVGDDPDYGDVPYPPAHPYCQCSITEIIDTAVLQDSGDDQ